MVIDITRCVLADGEVTDIPAFDIEGFYDDEEFRCKFEISFLKIDEFDEDDFSIDYIDGWEIDSSDLEQVKALLTELKTTSEFRDVYDEFLRQEKFLLED